MSAGRRACQPAPDWQPPERLVTGASGTTVRFIEEAGGRFTDLKGVSTAAGGTVLSSNGLLHEEALARIAT